MRLDAATAAMPDVEAHLTATAGVVVLPFGALEAHGPHLPLGTDTMTAQRIAEGVADALDGLLLPAIPFGETWNTAGYPGTVSLSAATVTTIVTDIGRAFAGTTARALVVVNGDWGNREPLGEAAQVLTAEQSIPTLVLNHPGMDAAIETVRTSRPAAPGLNHAEEIETSIMLAIAPDTVHTNRYEAAYPDFPDDFGSRRMQLHPFSPSGVFGDPTAASADKGQFLIDATVAASIDAVRAFLLTTPDQSARQTHR